MIFAILGLRTLYFLLEALKDYLAYLEKPVIVLLFFSMANLGQLVRILDLRYIRNKCSYKSQSK